MAQVNEVLIKTVFDEMVKHKPSLSKYLTVDPGDQMDTLDSRILADMVITYFPWPIGVELRRMFSGSMRQLDRRRLDQLLKTLERTMQFISFILLSQLWEEKINRKFSLPREFTNDFSKRISLLSLGNYIWMVRSIGNLFTKEGLEPFMPEMNQILNNKFYADLDFWVPERNEIGHYQINLTTQEIEKRCVEYEDKLTRILLHLAFIVKYKLVTVRDIKVLKIRHKQAKYNHLMDLLNSPDSDFKGIEMMHDEFSDSNAVLLMKDFKIPTEFLNLSPFVIDTHLEVIDTKEKFEIQKDIFMYTKFTNDRLMYIGTEVTEKCDLTSLSNYHLLVEQFKEMLASFSPEGSLSNNLI